MQSRPGLARLLPLIALTGLAAGTIALLASARTAQAPPREVVVLTHIQIVPYDGGCSDMPAPAPSDGFVDSAGRRWHLSEIPGHDVKGLPLAGAEWFGVNLRGATFTACSFRGADLRQADLADARLWECDFTGADLTDADVSGVKYDVFTRWPAGFDPQAHGARLVR